MAHESQDSPNSSDETRSLDTSTYLGERAQPAPNDPTNLFEHYERRSLRTIIQQQQAYRDSQAARAARVILDGAQIPAFDPQLQDAVEYEDFEQGDGLSPRLRRIRVQQVSGLGRLMSPGAQVVYVLLVIAALGGTLGLAFSTNSPHMLLFAGIAAPMLLPLCVWRWVCWLDSAPYYYRLLTSLGEDARNLLDYRLLWKRTSR